VIECVNEYVRNSRGVTANDSIDLPPMEGEDFDFKWEIFDGTLRKVSVCVGTCECIMHGYVCV
jgi:hypothetical protein